MNVVQFHVEGDAATAKSTVVEALDARKFTLSWNTEWSATAERGNKIVYTFLGAFAQYFRVGVSVMTAPEGDGIKHVDVS